jgi:hypothetical protein
VVEFEKRIAAIIKVRNVTSWQCEAPNVRHGQCCLVNSVWGIYIRRLFMQVYAILRLEAGPFCSIRAYRYFGEEPRGWNESRVSHEAGVMKHVF